MPWEYLLLIDILKGTPWWVYALFVYLVINGVKSLKPHTIPLKKAFILPVIFLVWGLSSLSAKLGTFLNFGLWIGCLAVGAWLGWHLVRHVSVKSSTHGPVITSPGGPLTLILILAIFFVKYFFGFTYATNPLASTDIGFVRADIILSGFLTGMFVGRALHYWYKWKNRN